MLRWQKKKTQQRILIFILLAVIILVSVLINNTCKLMEKCTSNLDLDKKKKELAKLFNDILYKYYDKLFCNCRPFYQYVCLSVVLLFQLKKKRYVNICLQFGSGKIWQF